jgi:hypothetical protein
MVTMERRLIMRALVVEAKENKESAARKARREIKVYQEQRVHLGLQVR